MKNVSRGHFLFPLLPQLSAVMTVANCLVDLIDIQASSVLVCFEDGWDATAQVMNVFLKVHSHYIVIVILLLLLLAFSVLQQVIGNFFGLVAYLATLFWP